jgi:hypothetical protein
MFYSRGPMCHLSLLWGSCFCAISARGMNYCAPLRLVNLCEISTFFLLFAGFHASWKRNRPHEKRSKVVYNHEAHCFIMADSYAR